MSIAASVVIKPSRWLFALTAALCLGAAAVGWAVALGAVGELALWLRLVCASLCTALAGAGFAGMMRRRKIYRLDISGSGQIRLRPARPDLRQMPEVISKEPDADGILVTLLADSTLWPRFLMLRLQDESGRVHVLSILPDSVSAESFRAVSVACRWIAVHRFSNLN